MIQSLQNEREYSKNYVLCMMYTLTRYANK